MRLLAVTALAISVCATGAWADETISTAAPSDVHPPIAAAAPGPLNAATSHAQDGDVVIGPCGRPMSVGADGKPDLRPTGEVSVGVGTGGYRMVEGSVCKPTADGGFIAISAGQMNAPNVGWGRR